MNKFQKVSFHDYDEFFDYLPAEEQKLVQVLRSIILETIPEVTEKISYNVPFYSLRKRICYIWPSAIPWGGLVPGSGVALGFSRGRELQADYLNGGKGRDVRYRLFSSVGEIDRQLLSDLLMSAVILESEGNR